MNMHVRSALLYCPQTDHEIRNATGAHAQDFVVDGELLLLILR